MIKYKLIPLVFALSALPIFAVGQAQQPEEQFTDALSALDDLIASIEREFISNEVESRDTAERTDQPLAAEECDQIASDQNERAGCED